MVAAPLFPLEDANAPGGPDESDLVNEPCDVSFVVTRLLALNRANAALAERIDPARIPVAGHSDGAVTALATAYDRRFRDSRVRAAIVLSGAALAGMRPFPPRGPPLLAVQGTADPIQCAEDDSGVLRPRTPSEVPALAARSITPCALHGPGTTAHYVERTTVAFLDHYLRGRPLRAFERAARRPGLTRLTADP